MSTLSRFHWNHRKWRSWGAAQIGSTTMSAAELATDSIVSSLFQPLGPVGAKVRAARTEAAHWRLSSRRAPTVLVAIAALVALTFVFVHLLMMIIGAPVFSEPTAKFPVVASKPVTASVPSLLMLHKRPFGFEPVEAVGVWRDSWYAMPQAFMETVAAEPMRFSHLPQMRKLSTESVGSIKDSSRNSARSRSVAPKAESIDRIAKFIDENMKRKDPQREYEAGHTSARSTTFDAFPFSPHETQKARMLKEAGIGSIDVFSPHDDRPPQQAQIGQQWTPVP